MAARFMKALTAENSEKFRRGRVEKQMLCRGFARINPMPGEILCSIPEIRGYECRAMGATVV